MTDASLGLLYSQPLARQVFDAVVKNRSISVRDLLAQTKLTADTVRDAVRDLKSHSLIKEAISPIEDFNLVYVTADGLEATRKMSR